MPALLISNTTPIPLTDSIDAAGSLQIHYQSNALSDHGNALTAEKENLATAPVRIELHDFSHGGNNWTVSATHVASGQTITWTRDTGASHVWNAFGETGGELGIDLVATTSGQTKTKRIFIEVKPPVEKPDGP